MTGIVRLLVALLVLAAPGLGVAATIRIAPDGSAQYRTVREAIDALPAGGGRSA